MKFLKSVVIALFIAASFVACNKEKTPPQEPQFSIEGNYFGKWGFGDDIPDNDYKFSLHPGGVFQEIDDNSGDIRGEGTWQLNGNIMTAEYAILYPPFTVYSLTAEYNQDVPKLIGTWGYDDNPTDGGKFEMYKP